MAGIKKVRLFDPNPDALSALHNSDIDVILGVLHEHLQGITNDLAVATQWVNDHVVPHTSAIRFTTISAGNEILPDGADSPYILPRRREPAIHPGQHDRTQRRAGRVVPTIRGRVLGQSQGLYGTHCAVPEGVNAYSYYGYASDPNGVRLDYSIFTANGTVITDGSLEYQNMFDAILDAFCSALEKV
ncbi:Glucan endo-1,3-beta-glucosidase [Acorus calamus]|uniref:Glucan endo-1,3-beta-glucosidase n=1 Tax=Acorus calamus TaxID=4465 RepID=A0AAV9D5B0_ACOCL|nr:Glucan endo-1,3-beta-glucosidase [Acorus calamus]